MINSPCKLMLSHLKRLNAKQYCLRINHTINAQLATSCCVKMKNTNGVCLSSHDSNNTVDNSVVTKSGDELNLPEPPTTCCMSGCANCVWLAYANELMKCFHDGEERARMEILERIEDPNLKMFLLMELKSMKKRDG